MAFGLSIWRSWLIRHYSRAVIDAFKLPAVGRRTMLEMLVAYLEHRQVLLIFDNCEHLIEACAQLAEQLLSTCHNLRILVTSREHLRCAGEVEWRVPSLTRPPLRMLSGDTAAGQTMSPNELQYYEAARMFVARVQMLQPDFILNTDNTVAVANICSRLDGIPLALEMTAARATSMTVQEIADQLAGMFDQRFALLTSGARTAPPRHRTLRAALEWGYSLLEPAEQRLLARISVFCGGWTAEAAEFVAGNPDSELRATMHGATSTFLGLLAELVNNSLVIADRNADRTRYRMLETVRQFGAEKLSELGETNAIFDRHLTCFLNLVKQTDLIMLTGPQLKTQLAILDAEVDNLRVALQWAQQVGDPESFALLVAALWPYWRERGDHREGRKWLGVALAHGDSIPTALQARLQVGVAALLFHVDAALMILAAERAVELSRATGDLINLAWSYTALGAAFWRKQEYHTAQIYLEQGLELSYSVDSPETIRSALLCLGNIMINYEEWRTGAAYLEECVALAWKWQEPAYLVWALRELAYLDITGAMTACERELARQRVAHDPDGLAQILQCFGRLLLEHGDYARARDTLVEAVALWRTLEFQWCAHGSLALTLFDLALAAWLNGESDLAVKSFMESQTLFRQVDDAAVSFHVHLQFGYFWLEHGEPVQAYTQFLESVHRLGVSGWTTHAAVVVAGLAEVARVQRQELAAARLFGAADQLSDNPDLRITRSERVGFDRVMKAAHAQWVDPVYAANWTEGKAMSWRAAVDYAVETLDSCLPASPLTSETPIVHQLPASKRDYPAGLTGREVEILRLVADGLSDNQIAQRLIISPRTVNTHLSTIFRKLNVSSRLAAVRYALNHALF